MEIDESKNLLPAYATLYNKIKALFGDDPELIFSPIDDTLHAFSISSKNQHKLNALQKALDLERFKEVGLTVLFIRDDPHSEWGDFLTDLFAGNPHFSRTYITSDPTSKLPLTLCYFKNETIQYKNDDRFVPGGYETKLAEQLTRELFKPEARKLKFVTECEIEDENF